MRLVLGVLTDGEQPSRRRPWGPRTSHLAHVLRAAERAGMTAVAFTPDGWTGSGVARGLRLDGGRWLPAAPVRPDVVYNRLPNRRIERSARGADCLASVRHHLGSRRLFNPGFLDKDEVVAALRRSPETAGHVPPTAVDPDPSRLGEWVREYDAVYLKPVDGRAGSGIWRVSRAGRSGLQLTGVGYPPPVVSGRRAVRRLVRLLRRGRLVMQRSMDLCASPAGGAFDFRVLVQRGRSGRWHLTGIGVRQAKPGAITTHRPRGGRIGHLAEALARASSLTGRADAAIRASIGRLAKAAAMAVESYRGEMFGECSVDMGLDRRGHPWLFEVNAKPMVFDEPSIERRRTARLIRFVCFLAAGASR